MKHSYADLIFTFKKGNMANVSDLRGKTIIKIYRYQDRINFICNDGVCFSMFHPEFVTVIGDLDDLIGTPIEEVTSSDNPDIQFATKNGYVTIRYGESSRYYFEQADLEITAYLSFSIAEAFQRYALTHATQP